MASTAPKVLVFGATGVIGHFLITALLAAQPPLARLAIFTSTSTADKKPDLLQSLRAQGVEIIIGDARNPDDVRRAYVDVDTVVSALGRGVIADQIELLRIAEATPNVTRFFPSEYGTDIEFGPQSATEKPHQEKLKVRRFIREHVKRLEYTYLVTGPFADLYVGGTVGNFELGGYDVKQRKAVLLGTGDEKIALTTRADVGKLLVAVLQHPAESRNRALIVNSFTATPKEILAEYERQTGAKWEVSRISLDDWKRRETELWEQGSPLATLYTLRRIWAEGGTRYDTPRDNERIGFTEAETLEGVVADAIGGKNRS